MAEIGNILFPLFVLLALGAALRRSGFVPAGFFHQTNKLVYWVAIPCYLFYKTAEATIEGGAALRVFLVILAGMIAAILAAYVVGWGRRMPPPSTAAFVQGAFRSNLAYVGLPVVLLALPGPETKGIAVLAIALMVPIYNLVAVSVLTAGQTTRDIGLGTRLRQVAARLVTNPLLLSCMAGLVVLWAGWPLPPAIRTTCATLGDMTTPLALMGIGSSLTVGHLKTRWREATLGTLIKLVVSPLAGLLLAVQLGLAPSELRMALIYLASPSAGASYVMAQQLGADDALAADIIVLSTALSFVALGVVLAVT